ncbi:MAG TPA: DUF4430 domain-containing protein [Solirubrobacteraceae bacterium]|nr:DUF4430 domain-containing protein [Solirubrobacteraceae bacterium]
MQLLVTRDFGARVLGSWAAPSARGEETVMSLLERNAQVSTRYSGGFVQSIDGVSAGHERAQPVDWFYYVNGIEAPLGAAETKVRQGDHVWWDRHDWSQTDHIPAVVGSFPEPFTNGIAGERLPTRVQCSAVGAPACKAVVAALRSAGVPAAVAAIGGGGPHTLNVLVAPWQLISGDLAAHAIASGPAASGVYATFSRDGRTLSLLDQDGARRSSLTGSAGLVAATRVSEEAPTWVVTGTDQAGLALAAGAFNASTLAGRFALAVSSAGTQALPLVGQ